MPSSMNGVWGGDVGLADVCDACSIVVEKGEDLGDISTGCGV